jgi:glyoxylase-like metal-dependent hydrolase (beta-lactamase superfamily II)
MVSRVRPAFDFDRIASNIAIWHDYDPGVKAEMYSTSLTTSEGMYLIDPIPLKSEALGKLIGGCPVAGVIVTNSNHYRASHQFAEQFSVSIFARCEAFPDKAAQQFRSVADGDEICRGLRAISIEGAAAGEMILHYASNSGTMIVGDALINFEPYGLTFLPGKYCSNEKEMRWSLQKLLDYEAERILFAHGTPILSGASDCLRDLLGNDF